LAEEGTGFEDGINGVELGLTWTERAGEELAMGEALTTGVELETTAAEDLIEELAMALGVAVGVAVLVVQTSLVV
jgi:hypothetical protein